MSQVSSAAFAANQVLSFLLELVMLFALGYWAWWAAPEGMWRYVASGAIVVVAIGLWAVLAAPRATARLPMPWLAVFKIALFGLAAAGLWVAGRAGWAGVFAALVVLNIALMAAFGDW